MRVTRPVGDQRSRSLRHPRRARRRAWTTASPFTSTAFSRPPRWRSGRDGMSVGCTRSSMPLAVRRVMPEQLDAVAESSRVLDVERREPVIPSYRRGRTASDAVAIAARIVSLGGVDALHVEGGVGLGVTEALRLGEPCRTQALVAHPERCSSGALMIPAIHSMRLAVSPSRGLDDGHAAGDRCPNATITPLAWARAKISVRASQAAPCSP